jgi:hypothetical protein
MDCAHYHSEAIELTQRLCAECGIPIKSIGGNKFLMGVRLKGSESSKQRLGSMARKRDTA